MENTASPTRFSNLQLELLKIYSMNLTDEELGEIKNLMADFFAKKDSRKTIEKEVVDALNAKNAEFKYVYFDREPWQKRWTKILKEALSELGRKLNYGVSTSGESGDEGEWLFDVVWWEMAENNKSVKSIPLVLESEISSMHWGAFKKDFEKLLVATSSVRIFITRDQETSNPEMALSEKIKFANEAVQNFTAFKRGDVVYLIVWEENKIRDGGEVRNEFTLIPIFKK